MGHTHYFNRSSGTSKKIWDVIISDCKKAYAASGLTLYKDFNCPLAPLFGSRAIRFNGLGIEGHETFYIPKSGIVSDFCKTALKPYDLMVMMVLLIYRHHDKSFSFSSDGYWNEEWLPARELFQKTFGFSYE